MKIAIKNFKKYQYLLFELVKKDIKLKYRRSYLGILWTLLEPILTTVVLAFVFSTIRENKDPLFPVYILSGRLIYTFFANSTKAAMKSIRSNAGMIKKVYVPKYIYPFSSVLSNFVTFLISLIVLVGAMIIYRMDVTIHLVAIILPMLLILILSLGVGMILATLAVFFRDLEYLWSVALMLLLYTSPIFYYSSMLIDKGKGWIFNFNPLYFVIVNFRNAIYGRPMDLNSLYISCLYGFGFLIIGIFLFYKKQDKFILNI